MQGHSFDHSSVRMSFNRTHMPTGPGQFKLDPYLIKTGSLDSVIKQTIYEANLFNTENAELTKIYEDRNTIENNDPGQDKEEEADIIEQIEAENTKLPKLKLLQDLNKQHADRVLGLGVSV